MRGAKATYDGALWLLRRAKELADYPVLTKTGIIVGLGETNDEIVETLRDLRANGVDVVTIGQYLQPSAQARRDRPLGASGRVPLAPRAGRGARLRLRLRRPARPLELPRRRAEACRRHRPSASSRTEILARGRTRVRQDPESRRSSSSDHQPNGRNATGSDPHDDRARTPPPRGNRGGVCARPQMKADGTSASDTEPHRLGVPSSEDERVRAKWRVARHVRHADRSGLLNDHNLQVRGRSGRGKRCGTCHGEQNTSEKAHERNVLASRFRAAGSGADDSPAPLPCVCSSVCSGSTERSSRRSGP